MPAGLHRPEPYRADIDGLRAIAVLSVIAYHFDRSLLPSGYLGVDIFFVISGYVITGTLQRQPSSSQLDFLTDFYARRLKRLLPALILCTVVTAFVGCVFVAPIAVGDSLRAGIYALFGISNIYFYQQAIDYFGASADLNLFTHTWSLGVEEQFYLLFPTLFWLFVFGPLRGVGRWRFGLLLGMLVLTSLAAYIAFAEAAPFATYYLMPFRFWELGAGCLTYVLFGARPAPASAARNIVGVAALGGLLACLLAPVTQQLAATIAAVACTSVLIGLQSPGLLSHRLLTTRVMVYIGLISYSLYLWHWSVLSLSRWTIGVTAWTAPFQLALIFGVAAVSYALVERPLRYAEWSRKRWLTIANATGAALLSAVLIGGVALPLRRTLYAGIEASIGERGLAVDKWQGQTLIWKADDCTLTSDAQVGKTISFEGCAIGQPTANGRRFLVIGNSFSEAQFEMFQILSDAGLGQGAVTSSWGASPVAEVPNRTPWAAANTYYWSTVVPKLLQELKAGDVVLMINDVQGFVPAEQTPQSSEMLHALRAGLGRLSGELRTKGIRIVFQSAVPFVGDSNCTPDKAVKQWFRTGELSICTYFTREQSLQRRRPLHDLLLDIQRTNANFFVLDIFPVLCPESVCKLYNRDGVFLFRDRTHPSIEANVMAQETLRRLIEEAVSQPIATGYTQN